MKIRSTLRLGASFALAVGSPAAAQVVIAGQSVADRARPDFDAIGSSVGGFRLFPSVTTSIEATDNYLATNTNRRGDVFLTVQPEALIRSEWARNRLEARAYLNEAVHARLTGENATQYGASVAGAYDVSRVTQFRGDVSAARYVESRTSLGSFQGSQKPVTFEVYHAGIGASHAFNDLALSANTAIEYRNFNDAPLIGGGFVDQDFRDVRTVSAGGGASYALRNGISLTANAQYSDDRYTLRPGRPGFAQGTDINRNSSGYNLQGGVSLELSRLIFGNIAVGYLTRRYDDPRLRNFSGLSFNADVLWNVTPLTSIRARASRSIQDTSSPLIAGNTRSDIGVRVDHELYRYLIVSGDVNYGRFRPNGVGFGGNEYSVGAGARYLIDRRYSVSANIRHSGRSSDSQFLRYQATTVGVSLRIQF